MIILWNIGDFKLIENNNKTNNLIDTRYTIIIYNILQMLGLIPTLKGTKLLIKAILIIINSKEEFIIFEDIYKQIASKYKTFNSVQIRNSIKYAIDNRNEQKSKANFEKVFGFEYDQYYFTNKTIIEEIARVIKLEVKI